ncbi:MAG: hypothetical protein AB8F78_19720 [Saprospiraceae bacterium]
MTLPTQLPAGTSYTIYISGRGGSATSDVWEASNGASVPGSQQNSPSGFTQNGQATGPNAVIVAVTKVTQIPTRYLYFDRGSGDIEIHAVAFSTAPPAEICNNGLDDDGDGLVDCLDCSDCTSCSDNDNDGITDACDLDDDNDGIPDLVECTNYSLGPELIVNGGVENGYAHWTSDFSRGFNNFSLTNGGCPQMGWVAVSACASETGSCSAYFNYTGSVPTGSTLITTPLGIGANVISPSPCNTTSGDCLASALADHTTGSGLSLYVDPNDIVGESYWIQNVSVAANTTYEFSAWLMVIEEDPNLQFKINGAGLGAGFNLDRITPGSNGPDIWQKFSKDWFSGSTSGTVTIELVNLTAGCYGNDLRLDDVSFRSKHSLCDVDNDGIANQFDLDSDNDGIHDLDEAGHASNDSNNDGIIDGGSSAFGSNGLYNGIETSAGSGVINYTVRNTNGSGAIDAFEIDADGDGCFDATEEGVSDGDFNGIAEVGTPTVTSRGLVVGSPYTNPSVNAWQNAAVNGCTTISGRVFEDINYGGGSARTYYFANISSQASGWASGAIGVANARVELYTSVGVFVAATTSDAWGKYSFNNVLPRNYHVRLSTTTVRSNRASNGSGQTALGVLIFKRINATLFTTSIGGADPNKVDAPSNLTSSNFSSLNSATTVAQAVSTVSGISGDVINVNFGLSFNVITHKKDGGIGSLRQFIINSNELSNTNIDLVDNPPGRPVLAKPTGEDVSIFEIPGTGPYTVALSTALPHITDRNTHISGYTQNGSVQGLPQTRRITIAINGSAGSFNAFRITNINSSVSGLAIYSVVRGVNLIDNGVSGTHVWGNYIGLDHDGVTSRSNTERGVVVYRQTGAFIGTNGDGVNDLSEGNVIARSHEGVHVSRSSGSLIAGNYIGVDRTGLTDAGNRFRGVTLTASTGKNVVGLDDNISTLTAAAARNVISGNDTEGVLVDNSSNQVIAGNYIGTGYLGTSSVGNLRHGIHCNGLSSSVQIGTDSDNRMDIEERNVVSGNRGGIQLGSGATGTNVWIAGNYVGVDVTGNTSLPNTNNGIVLNSLHANTIVGTNGDGVRDVIERNIVSGNHHAGIYLGGAGGVRIAGNYVGVGANGTEVLSNLRNGIVLVGSTSSNTIGYSTAAPNGNAAEVGNVIRNNSEAGINIYSTGSNNRFSRNSYGSNGQLAIDLLGDRVTVNDNGDADNGPNRLRNYPVLTYSKIDATTLRLKGFAPAGATIELYIADAGPSPNPLPSGFTASFCEGYSYLGEIVEGSGNDDDATTGTYTNDGSGSTSTKSQRKFSFDIPLSSLNTTINVGDKITAIAIDASGNTSEFGGSMFARFIEICNDTIDNDGDGDVDCRDSECPGGNSVTRINH